MFVHDYEVVVVGCHMQSFGRIGAAAGCIQCYDFAFFAVEGVPRLVRKLILVHMLCSRLAVTLVFLL